MDFLELLVIAVGVSMDAFAVSICKGLSVKTIRPVNAAVTGLWCRQSDDVYNLRIVLYVAAIDLRIGIANRDF